jgi:hypothetical protein
MSIAFGLIGGLVGRGTFWVLATSPEAGTVAVAIGAFNGATALIIGQRKIWPVIT